MIRLAAVVLTVALAVWLVAHALLVWSVRRRAWWRALVAAVVPPLAPYWGWSLGVRWRVMVWFGALLFYAVALVVGSVAR
jgi:hypothetical protein